MGLWMRPSWLRRSWGREPRRLLTKAPLAASVWRIIFPRTARLAQGAGGVSCSAGSLVEVLAVLAVAREQLASLVFWAEAVPRQWARQRLVLRPLKVSVRAVAFPLVQPMAQSP